jgi:enamine deaminase RidA (YjgF/YER057c/UK114 family)
MTKRFAAVTPAAGWNPKLTFSAATRVGDLVFLSGMTAGDEKGRIVGEGDIARQTEYIYEKMGRILEAAGCTLGDVVETTEYYLTLEGYERTADVRRKVFGGPPYPAATGVQCAGLIRPGALIEIKAVAVAPRPTGAP